MSAACWALLALSLLSGAGLVIGVWRYPTEI